MLYNNMEFDIEHNIKKYRNTFIMLKKLHVNLKYFGLYNFKDIRKNNLSSNVLTIGGGNKINLCLLLHYGHQYVMQMYLIHTKIKIKL